ncbi:hypothetical protein J2X06_001647 [Lysobacter niastensis]|uniref:DUF2884 family protein n=1 Tax=Lysobacter niastensis TaxID=380629 RepID=A0ABU1WA68_9GAMM|nr:hypothetical protein [Lysobacter niastensis]MDR7134463.1 hypothetical protein [Lysobacter niastensis]
MNSSVRTLVVAALLSSLPLLGACESKAPAPAGNDHVEPTASVISKATREALKEVRKELAEGNISISDDHGQHGKAEITPQGDLLIDGRAITITAEQRKLLLEHRGHIIALAEAGAEVGMQGADLATKAMGEALKGVFTGNTDEIEKRVEAEAGKMKASALKLCDKLPAMMASQQKLKASLPEFAPYATMDQDDIKDCRDEVVEREGTKHENFAAKAAAEPSKEPARQ